MKNKKQSTEIIYTDTFNISTSGSTLLTSQEPPSPAKNYFASTMALTNSTIGITILIMPKLFHVSGIVFGTIQLLILAMLNFITSYMLCWAGNIFDLKSYFEIGERVFKGKQKYLMHFFYLAMLIGNILCYQTFVLQSLNELVGHLMFRGEDENSIKKIMMRIVICIVANMLILPYLFSRRLKKIKILSKICTMGVFFGIGLVCAIYIFPFVINHEIQPINYDHVSYFNFKGVYTSIGVYMLSYCFHLIVVDINHELNPKSNSATKLVIFSNCLIAFVVYFLVSLFGYLTVLEETNNIDKLSNFFVFLIIHKGNNSYLLYIACFIIAFAVLIGNIMNYLPLIRFLNGKYNYKAPNLPSGIIEELNLESSTEDQELSEEIECKYSRTYKFIVFVTFLAILATMAFIVIFNIQLEIVFNFVSAICAAPVCIIIPIIFYLYLLNHDYFKNTNPIDFTCSYTVLGFGILIWLFSIYSLFQI